MTSTLDTTPEVTETCTQGTAKGLIATVAEQRLLSSDLPQHNKLLASLSSRVGAAAALAAQAQGCTLLKA